MQKSVCGQYLLKRAHARMCEDLKMDGRGDWTLIGAPPLAPGTDSFCLHVLCLVLNERSAEKRSAQRHPLAPQYRTQLSFSFQWFMQIAMSWEKNEWLPRLYVWVLLLICQLHGREEGGAAAIAFHSLRRKLKHASVWCGVLMCGQRGPSAFWQHRWPALIGWLEPLCWPACWVLRVSWSGSP